MVVAVVNYVNPAPYNYPNYYPQQGIVDPNCYPQQGSWIRINSGVQIRKVTSIIPLASNYSHQ